MTTPAVAEPATAPTPAETPIGKVYEEALKKQQGTPEPTPEPAVKAPQEAPKGKGAAEPVKEPAKPASALDAALETTPEPTKAAEGVAEDPLKEFPEDDKKPNWKKAREVIGNQAKTIAQVTAENQTLRKQLETTKATPPEALKELETIKAENAQLRDAITAVNLELLPDFRAEFIEGRKELVNSAIEKLKAYGGNVSALQRALALPEGKDRDEAVEAAFGEDGQVTEGGKTKIRNIIAEIERKDEAKAKRMADPQQSFEAYQQKQSASQKKAAEEAEAQRQARFEQVTKGLATKSPMFKTVDASVPGAEEWNKAVTDAISTARNLVTGKASFDETAEAAAKAGRYDALEKMFLDTRTELMAAKKQLAEYDGAQPDAKGHKPPPKGDKETKMEKSAGQVYTETMANLSGQDIG